MEGFYFLRQHPLARFWLDEWQVFVKLRRAAEKGEGAPSRIAEDFLCWSSLGRLKICCNFIPLKLSIPMFLSENFGAHFHLHLNNTILDYFRGTVSWPLWGKMPLIGIYKCYWIWTLTFSMHNHAVLPWIRIAADCKISRYIICPKINLQKKFIIYHSTLG